MNREMTEMKTTATIVVKSATALTLALLVSGAARAAEWGTLTGRFVLDGAAPTPVKIKADKDPEVCAKHDLVEENVVVGKDGGVQNVVIYLNTKSPDVAPSYDATKTGKVTVDNSKCRFEPHVAFMRNTQTLELKNSDPIGHNTKADPIKNPGFNVLLPANGSVDQKLAQEETLPVKIGCNIHPWMGGYVVVRSNPYGAVSAADGKFEIKDLPAGKELEFRLWQETPGYLKNVKVGSASADTKGLVKLKIKPGANDVGDIKIPLSLLKK